MARLNNLTRRQWLKRGALFVPAAFGILRARAQVMQGPIMRTIAGAGGGGGGAFTFRVSGENGATASGTTIAATLAGIVAGDTIIAAVQHESTATTITVSDGTTSLTAGTKSAATPWLQMFYLPSSVASGSVTYTATYASGRTYRGICVAAFSHTGTSAYDTQSIGTNTTSPATSGNITTASDAGIVACGALVPAAGTASAWQINGVTYDGKVLNETTALEMWWRIVSASFTGAATCNITTNDGWKLHVLALKDT